MQEVWKDIPNYEGIYQVSTFGRVKSLSRKGTVNYDRILKHSDDGRGYLKVNLYFEGILKNRKIHQLVAEAFLGHNPNGFELVVDHVNDNTFDNRLENLQLVTQRFNSYKTQGKYTSIYKGVSWKKTHNKWTSQIRINGVKLCLGYFDNEIDAYNAYIRKMEATN